MNTSKVSKSRARAFFFHFNKPMSRIFGKPKISVHHKGICHIVDNVSCEVPVQGRINKKQPMFVMAGKGVLTVVDGIAYIQ